jgi:hypothetical protein
MVGLCNQAARFLKVALMCGGVTIGTRYLGRHGKGSCHRPPPILKGSLSRAVALGHKSLNSALT